MLKNCETTLFEIDRYTWVGVLGCVKQIESWIENPLQYAENLLYSMEEDAEELEETVQSTPEEIACVLAEQYIKYAKDMCTDAAKISDSHERRSRMEFYAKRGDKFTKWIERFKQDN